MSVSSAAEAATAVVTSPRKKCRRRQQRVVTGAGPTGTRPPKSLGEPKTGTTKKEADSTENGAAGLNGGIAAAMGSVIRVSRAAA